MRSCLTLTLLIVFSTVIISQKVNRPNYGLKSPSSAEIVSVDYRSDCTVIEVKISNEVENGFFCIDKNTYLVKPGSNTVLLEKVIGLPFCPDVYKFREAGESINVKLIFPATGYLEWFSLVEECDGGCLTFRGVVTDQDMNKEIETAFGYVESGAFEDAVESYKCIIEKYDTGIEGALYSVLVKLYYEKAEPDLAEKWYKRMVASDVPDLELYIENLRQQGIKY